MYTLDQVMPSAPVAIVFGAGLNPDGTPTPYLYDRVSTAVTLYQKGFVRKLVMSGDNRSLNYNEPQSMKNLAIKMGIPETDIVLDYAGLRSYDTCYRARYIFGIRQAILVSQEYHLPRAIYTCNQLGVEAIGVSANRRPYDLGLLAMYTFREILACDTALLDIFIFHPQPVLGPFEPIFTARGET